ncbi:MAG: hypothetical protein WBA93_17265 [Microcoleaceae cyanobacterium]
MAKYKLIWYGCLFIFSACLSILLAELIQIWSAFSLAYLAVCWGTLRIFRGNLHPKANESMAANLGRGIGDYGWCLLIVFTAVLVGGGSSWLLWTLQQLF